MANLNKKIRGTDPICLPLDIIENILSRLPVKAIARFRAVSPSWNHLIRSPGFAKICHFNTISKIAVYLEGRPYQVIQFEDDDASPAALESPFRGCMKLLEFELPMKEHLYSSANGLLFLCNHGMEDLAVPIFAPEQDRWPQGLYICNPIRREYMKLPDPDSFSANQINVDTYGFGLSADKGEFKVVRIFQTMKPAMGKLAEWKGQVYTIGTGSWGRIFSAGPYNYDSRTRGAAVNGKVHWLVHNVGNNSPVISCFDLGTEQFSLLALPDFHSNSEDSLNVSTHREHLWFVDNSDIDEIVFWEMRDYGDVGSWTKLIVIQGKQQMHDGLIWPVFVFKNGDIYMAEEVNRRIYFYSKKDLSITDFHPSELSYNKNQDDWWNNPVASSYNQSFVSLRTYATVEDVIEF